MTCASNDASTSTETTSPPKCAAQSPTSTVNDPNSIADTTARLLGEEVLQKRWHRIEISDCRCAFVLLRLGFQRLTMSFCGSWATFRTYLHALYYDAAGWIPSRSRYLAHVYKDTGTPAPELQARQQTSFSAQTNVNVNGTPCCSAHAFYRLADRYLDVRLRERAKVAILRSLTVDTVRWLTSPSLVFRISLILLCAGRLRGLLLAQSLLPRRARRRNRLDRRPRSSSLPSAQSMTSTHTLLAGRRLQVPRMAAGCRARRRRGARRRSDGDEPRLDGRAREGGARCARSEGSSYAEGEEAPP